MVFGGKTNVTPLWKVWPSVQPVWAESILIAPPRAITAAALAGGVVVGVPPRLYAPYALTSAKATVLLNPSRKSAGRVPTLALLVNGIAPSPPWPEAGFQATQDPTLAA